MRSIPTLTAILLLGACFGACMDHTGQIAADNNVPPPVGKPDHKIVDTIGGGSGPTGGGGNNQGGTGTGGGNQGGGGGGPPGGGPVPEPGTMLLVGTGLAGLAISLRRRRKVAD